jgi:hypothetical protein
MAKDGIEFEISCATAIHRSGTLEILDPLPTIDEPSDKFKVKAPKGPDVICP